MARLDEIMEESRRAERFFRFPALIVSKGWAWLWGAVIAGAFGIGVGLEYWVWELAGIIASGLLMALVLLPVLIRVARGKALELNDEARETLATLFIEQHPELVARAFAELTIQRRRIKVELYIEGIIFFFRKMAAKETVASKRDLLAAAIEKLKTKHSVEHHELITKLGSFVTPLLLDDNPSSPIWKNTAPFAPKGSDHA